MRWRKVSIYHEHVPPPASPFAIFIRACTTLMPMTAQPNATHRYAAYCPRVSRAWGTNHHSYCLPRPALRQFDKAHGRENVCERAGRGSADELKDDTEVAGEQRKSHGGCDERSGEDHVAIVVEWLERVIVQRHDLAADKGFEGQGREHVQAEASALG